jgi:predicted molibdopterin-dependent oxidoreductase YjgC
VATFCAALWLTFTLPLTKVKKIRKGVMELYISDHPLDCLTCSANGDCELQDMAGMVGLRDVRYAALATHFRPRNTSGEANPAYIPKDTSNPYFTYDPAKCIVCSRCVRACEEVQGTFAIKRSALAAPDLGVQTRLSRDRVMENKPFYVLVSRPCPTVCPT